MFIRVLITFALLSVLTAQAARQALVIGNDNYSSVSKLQKAGNDAIAMARELKAAGFAVQLHRDLNYRTMVRTVEAFTAGIKGGDEVVVFFAGHGVQVKNGAYLLPTDIEATTESEVEKTSYELNALMEKLSDAKAAFSLVVVDACRDNPLKAKGRSVGNTRGLSAIEPPRGQMVVYSASRGQQALDRLSDRDANPNSVFTREFIARMTRPGVRIEDLVREVQDSVEELAGTVKHEQRPALYNEARGSFYFFAPVTGQAMHQVPARAEPLTQSAKPNKVEGLSLADLEREEITRKEWAAWQTKMRADFDKTAQFAGSADLQVKAWDRFLAAWAQDNPQSREDESLRLDAAARRNKARQVASAVTMLAEHKTEIKLGNTVPYSGPAAFYSCVGLSTTAYFAKVNDEGGINGRKVTVLSVDDALAPPKTVEQVRKLVEQEEVDAIVNQVGTATASSVRQYLNQKGVPQLFVQSGSNNFQQPKNFRFSTSALMSYEFEAKVYGQTIARDLPAAKVALLYQNDDYGKDYLRGLKAGWGKALTAEITYEQTDPTVDSQILALKASGADVVVLAAYSKQVSQSLRKMDELGWKPQVWISHVSAQVHPTLDLVGLDKVVGVMTAAVVKDPTDPTWHNDPDYKAYMAWMAKYQPKSDAANSCNGSVYMTSAAIAQVLKLAGNDLSREGILKAALTLKDFAAPMLLPGITMTMSADNYNIFRRIQLMRFDGKRWVPQGKPVGE